MKKIISALIILAMLCSAMLAVIPASADAESAWQDLKDLVTDVEDAKEDYYTQETWDAFATALEAAKALTNSQYAPAEDDSVAAIAALNEAHEALKEVTRDDLVAKLDEAYLIEEKGFSADTWKKLQDAITEAEYFCDDTEAGMYPDQIEDLRACYKALKNALKDMKYDTGALYGLINKAKGLIDNHTYAVKLNHKNSGGDYTDATYNPFVEVYNVAKENAKSNDYDLINKSVADLTAAMAALETISVSAELKAELADLLDLADVLIPSEWSESAWKMVEMKVEQANNAPKDVKNSTYVRAIKELEQALMNLTNEDKPDKDKLPARPVVDTEYLDNLIKWCEENLVETGYDADSWRKLTEALENAKNVSANPRKAENVKAAYDRLYKIKGELVAVEGAAGTTGDGAGAAGEDGGCNSAIGATVVVMTATLALGATVVLRKKED